MKKENWFMDIYEMPKVTVVIPSFNQGKFIHQTISSVLSQTYSNLQLIVVDGQSKDNTLEVLTSIKDERFSFISEQDKGHADAVNKGFSLGDGEFFGWLNSDDLYFDRHTISKVVNYFSKYPSVDVIYGDACIIDEQNNVLRLWCVPSYKRTRIMRGNMIVQPAVFFRKKVIKENKLALNCLPLDYEFWLRLGNEGYSFHHVNSIFACDRYHSARVSRIKRKELIKKDSELREKYTKDMRFLFFKKIGDRFLQAICRIRGSVICLLLFKQKKDSIIKIDHPLLLLQRQLFHNVIFD